MDWVTGLPPSRGFNSILVVCDRFSKQTHLLPCKKTYTAKDTAELFLREIVRLHGLPSEIISDRDQILISSFWRSLCAQLRITSSLSSARHPQSDGQSERTIQTLITLLRNLSNHTGTDWNEFLPVLRLGSERQNQLCIQTSTLLSPA